MYVAYQKGAKFWSSFMRVVVMKSDGDLNFVKKYDGDLSIVKKLMDKLVCEWTP